MIYKTGTQIISKVRRDLKIVSDPVIDDTDILDLINDSIDTAEATILTLNEDYFLTKGQISLVNGTADYNLLNALPLLYGNKIREILYINGTDIYEIKRLRSRKGVSLFRAIAEINQFGTASAYQYVLRNDSASSLVAQLVPPSRETLSNALTVWYIRNASRLALASDTCDIPEFHNFIVANTKRLIGPHVGWPDQGNLDNEAQTLLGLMNETLAGMVPDDNNEIEPDVSSYEEHT